MDTTELLSSIFDNKTVAILKKLLTKKDIIYLRDLSRESGVSLATTYRIIQKLRNIGLVAKEEHEKINYYKLVKDNPLYNELCTLIIGKQLDPLTRLKELVNEKYSNISLFALKDNKHKIFLVGDNIAHEHVDSFIEIIFNETGVKLDVLVSTPKQFNQMIAMKLVTPNKYFKII